MRSVNEVKLIGNLGGDPEVRYTPQGKAVARFSLATLESWKDGNGDKVEQVEWHRVIVWEPLAKVVGEFLKKGRQVYVSGQLRTRKWDSDGQTHYATEVIAREVLFLGAPSGSVQGVTPGKVTESARPLVYDKSVSQITDSDISF